MEIVNESNIGKILVELIQTANLETPYDTVEEYIPSEYCGGSFDEAFDNGYEVGQIHYAREVLDKLGIDWKNS